MNLSSTQDPPFARLNRDPLFHCTTFLPPEDVAQMICGCRKWVDEELLVQLGKQFQTTIHRTTDEKAFKRTIEILSKENHLFKEATILALQIEPLWLRIPFLRQILKDLAATQYFNRRKIEWIASHIPEEYQLQIGTERAARSGALYDAFKVYAGAEYFNLEIAYEIRSIVPCFSTRICFLERILERLATTGQLTPKQIEQIVPQIPEDLIQKSSERHFIRSSILLDLIEVYKISEHYDANIARQLASWIPNIDCRNRAFLLIDPSYRPPASYLLS